MPLMEFTIADFRQVQDELSLGIVWYAKWQHIHPTDPNRGMRVPKDVRAYEENFDTQHALDYFRTQPKYVIYQLQNG